MSDKGPDFIPGVSVPRERVRTITGRRWPPRDRQQEPPPPDLPAYWTPGTPPIPGDWQKALENLAPSVVIGSATYQLDAAGQAVEQYRAPFAALAVTSGSAQQLIVSTGPRGVAAPGPGPGTAIVPNLGHVTVNLRGNAWSIYGGLPGDLVTVQAFSKPMVPVAETGTFAPPEKAWTNATGNPLTGPTLTVNGTSGPISVVPYSTLLLQVNAVGPVTGTTPSMTVSILGVDALGATYPIAAATALTAAGLATVSAGPGTANGAVLPASVVVSWAITGTTPSFGDVVMSLIGRE